MSRVPPHRPAAFASKGRDSRCPVKLMYSNRAGKTILDRHLIPVPSLGTRRARTKKLSLSQLKTLGPSSAVIIIFEAYDIVLAEIGTGLHLDQLEVDLPRVFQTMPAPAWHVD
jgi:hypothetical protein